ncbi:MAG: hypothetical protein KAI64_02455 [Thermoplasmata archaeon]|nr:hypothetical protein [Thermoplasmata archaeon]
MKDIIDVLESEDVRRIILETYISAKSAADISSRLGLPLSKCYSLLKKLESFGLMESEEFNVYKGGRSKKVYRASLRNARMVMDNDRIMIQFDMPQEQMEGIQLVEMLT